MLSEEVFMIKTFKNPYTDWLQTINTCDPYIQICTTLGYTLLTWVTEKSEPVSIKTIHSVTHVHEIDLMNNKKQK